MREELGDQRHHWRRTPPSTHCYADFTVTLYPFTCRPGGGTITLHEHNAMLWIEPQHMPELDWATADLPVIGAYLAHKDLPGPRTPA